MKTSIGANHRGQFMRLQTMLEHYTAERNRLQAQLAYVTEQGAKADGEIFQLLLAAYHIDARKMPVSLDLDGGFIITPDPEEKAAPTEPVEAKEAEPAPTKPEPVTRLAKARG